MKPQINRKHLFLIRALAFSAPLWAFEASSQEYFFVSKINGVSAPPLGALSWPDFAAANSLPNDGDWNGVDWIGRGLTKLPDLPYPLTSAGGFLRFDDNPLTSIKGLANVEYANRLELKNVGLTDEMATEGLVAFRDFSYQFDLSNNDLTHLDFLLSMEGGGTQFLLTNNNLTNIDGLANITSHGGLHVSRNNLTHVDALGGITSFSHELDLGRNQINSIYGLRNLVTVGRSLDLGSNQLTDISDLSNLTKTGYGLDLSGNNLTSLSPLVNLTDVGTYIRVDNNSLTSLDGLENVTTSLSREFIAHNNDLVNVNGMSGLTYIRDELYLHNNPNLVDLSGLSGLTNVASGSGSEVEIRIDAGIEARPGFVPISAEAWLCDAGQSVLFGSGYAQQVDVCGP